MASIVPSIFLMVMIALTLILLPHLNDDRTTRADESHRLAEDIHVKHKHVNE